VKNNDGFALCWSRRGIIVRSDERAIILSKFKTLQVPAYRVIDEILILRAL
jgi:hypothetical protein